MRGGVILEALESKRVTRGPSVRASRASEVHPCRRAEHRHRVVQGARAAFGMHASIEASVTKLLRGRPTVALAETAADAARSRATATTEAARIRHLQSSGRAELT